MYDIKNGGRGICGTSIAGLKDYTTIYDKKLIIFQNDHGYKKIQQLLKSLFGIHAKFIFFFVS